MRHKRSIGLLGLVAAAALAAGLAATGGSAHGTKAGAADKSYKLYLIPKFIGIPVFTLNGAGAKEAGKKLGDSVTYNGPTQATGAAQVPFIDSAARQGYNAIIISANDPNAVAPALKRAAARGVKVISYDADTAPSARIIYVSPPDAKSIGFNQVDTVASQIGNKGKVAILSAAPTAANQNEWIKWMKVRLKLPKYKGIQLVKIAYGNDNDTKSAQEAQALLQAYPDLKGIISPTSVGVVAAARVLSQAKKCSIVLTGLGTPNTMRTYVKSGCVKKFALWNEQDFGYLAAYVAHNVLTGKLTGKAGQSFTAGRLGKRTVGKGGIVILSKPLIFTAANIDKFHF
jgi:rhamnose transport system substrate-binding protein